jgi:hypothetical protein
VISVTRRPYFTPGKGPVSIVQKAGWAPGPVWTGTVNLAPPGFDPRTVHPVVSKERINSAYSATNVQFSKYCHPNGKPLNQFKLGHKDQSFLGYDAVYSGTDITRFRGSFFLYHERTHQLLNTVGVL